LERKAPEVMNIQILVEPIQVKQVVLCFSGWPDAGKLVQHTLTEVRNTFPCEPAAVWDMDGFWHTDSARPKVVIGHGQIQRMDWPSYHFFICTPASAEPFVFAIGPEPTNNWRAFTQGLLGLLKGWGCKEIFLLGSLFDQIFHDEIIISSVVQDTRGFNQAIDLGCKRVDYGGPCAVHSAIMEAAQKMDIRCLAFWAHVPFYLNAPHELLMAHLLRILGDLLDLEFETEHLLDNWKRREREIEELIEQDPELRQALENMKNDDQPQSLLSTSAKVVRLDEFLKRRHQSTFDKE
jgi:hypothetical protein